MKYDLRKEKIAVHCQTLEEADKVQLKFKEIYNTYYNFSSRHKYWQYYGSETCFCVYSENNNDFGYSPKSFYEEEGYQIISASDYLSQFEEVPKYGDKVWVRNSENSGWFYKKFIGFTPSKEIIALVDSNKFESFNDGFAVCSKWKHYRTTDPTNDKKVLELTLSEIAEKLGVDEIKIKE